MISGSEVRVVVKKSYFFLGFFKTLCSWVTCGWEGPFGVRVIHDRPQISFPRARVHLGKARREEVGSCARFISLKALTQDWGVRICGEMWALLWMQIGLLL